MIPETPESVRSQSLQTEVYLNLLMCILIIELQFVNFLSGMTW